MEKEKIINSPYWPEDEYAVDNKITVTGLIEACKENKTVTGIVVAIMQEELIVKFGDIQAHLPFAEVTMYPLTYSKNKERKFPVQICTLLHKKVRVKVIEVNKDEITVSRKKNMIEACEVLKNCETVHCKVTNLAPKNLFCDIGDGINSILNIKEINKGRSQNVADFFHKGDLFSAKILFFDDLGRFNISYKAMFKEYSPEDYFPGDALECRVFCPVDNRMTGFYVSITPQVSGILDVTPWMPALKYGQMLEAIVKKAGPKGLTLRFVRMLS